jgi:fructokinase
MDGFHLDNRLLEPLGLLQRKGAPETFDSTGFVRLVEALAVEDRAVYPIFDRALDRAIAGAGMVGPEVDTVVVEGNYLLLNSAPWSALRPLWDHAIMLSVPIEELRRRLIDRWLHHGMSQEAAVARAEGNDLRNAQVVLAESSAEFEVESG